MAYRMILNNIKRFDASVKESHLGIGAWISELYCWFRHGSSPDDFFRYEFYKKTDLEREKFITYKRSKHIINTYNDKEYIKYFFDKANFNLKFKNFIHREWIDLRKCTQGEFEQFLNKHQRLIMKPMNGGQGRGIFILDVKDYDATRFNEFKDHIAEELLVQHHKMSLLNPSSVNTVRVLTFKGNIVACGLKIGGAGSPVDNFHLSDGIMAHVDIETGIIDTPCIDNQKRKRVIHPTSGLQLVGFSIPNWEKVKATVSEAAKIVPEVQYIGWDVAILEREIALIEANHDPGHDIIQIVAQNGVYEKIKKLV